MFVNVNCLIDGNTRLYTVQCNTFSSGVSYVEKNILRDGGGSVVGATLLQSTMDIKASIAEYCYLLTFYDKIGSISETYYMFTNDFKEVSGFITSMTEQGWFLRSCNYRQSEFLNALV